MGKGGIRDMAAFGVLASVWSGFGWFTFSVVIQVVGQIVSSVGGFCLIFFGRREGKGDAFEFEGRDVDVMDCC